MNQKRNYKQIDAETAEEEKIRKRDVIAVIFAIAGATVLIWGLI